MKHCPTCQTQFGGQEAFCPHDGTRLVAESVHQRGHLAGSSLNGTVNLEGFLFSDHLGERYRARLLSDNTQVRVTVFHRRFDAQRVERALEATEKLDRPLPEHLLSVHSVHADSAPTFVVEEWSEADPLARILKKKNHLTWRQALFLTIKVARVLQWMADAGVPHRAVHPRSLFIDALETGTVQLGEWFHGLLAFPLPDINGDTPTAAIPVYPGFIAPEWLSDGDVDLHRSAVYTAGAVLHTAFGQPLYDEDDDRNLHRWLDDRSEDPPQLELPDGAPEAITSLTRAMTAPSPSKRFEAPSAAIAALSSILDHSADDIAPGLVPKDETTFDAPPSSRSVAESDSEAKVDASTEDNSGVRKTAIGLPAFSRDDDSAAAHGPRVIVDDASTPEDHDAMPRQGPTTVERESFDDSQDGSTAPDDDDSSSIPESSRTRLMGMKSPVLANDEQADEPPDDGETTDDEPEATEREADSDADRTGETILNYSFDDPTSDDEVDSATDEDASQPSSDVADDKETDDDPDVEADDDEADNTETVDDEAEEAADDDTAVEADDDAVHEPGDDEAVDDERDADDSGESTDATDAEDEELSIGFVQAQQSEDDGASNVFFARSNEDAWEQEVVRASYERSKRMEKVTRTGMIIGGVVILVGAAIFFQGIYEPEEEEEETPEYSWGADEMDEEELEFEAQRFRDAIERGDIITPDDSSAEDILAELRRHVDEDTYWEYREQFVEGADRVSRQFEDKGDLRQAFLLARTASEYARGDEELVDRTERLYEDFQQQRRERAEAAAAESNSDPEDDSSEDEHDDAYADLLEDASAALSEHEYDEAAAGFSAVLEEAPDHLAATRGLAETYFREGSYEEALEYQRQVVDLAPNNVDDRLQLGMVYFRNDHYEEAIEQWEKVLENDEENRQAPRYIDMAERQL